MSVPALSQGVSYNSQAFTYLQQNANNEVRYIPNANVSVCIGTALPPFGATCTGTLANLFQDVALSVSANNPATTDQNGNFQFFVAQGLYVVSIWKPGFTTYSYVITLTGPGALTGPFTSSFFSSSSPNAAASGVFRLASGDLGPCYRNQANTADLCWSKNSVDVFSPPGSIASTFNNFWSGAQNFSGGGTLNGAWAGNPTLSGNPIFSGSPSFTGTLGATGQATITNPCAIDGVLYVSNAGCYATFAAALAQCKIQGSCVIDARGASTVTNIGTFDPNINTSQNASVTLLLGPYTYQVTQIVLRSNLNIIGSGNVVPAANFATNLVQASAGTAPIALATSGAAIVTIAQGVHLSNFNLTPAASSATDGISIVAAGCGTGCAGGGLWYSSFDHIYIQPGFGRNAIRVDGTNCDKCSAMQFASWRDIWAFRTPNSPPVLLISGPYVGQATFDACQFDLQFNTVDTNPNLANIQIDDTPPVPVTCPNSQCWVPYSIKFQNTTIQFAKATGGIGLLVKGGFNISCDNCHFEQDSTIASFVLGPGGHGSWGGVIMNSYIDSFAGTGGLINIDGNSSLFFHNNTEGANPPSGGFFVSGSVPSFVDWGGNVNSIGGAAFSPLNAPTITIAQLPPVSQAIGEKRMVSDSTAIASEGQTCTHAASSPVTAIAISNGTVWKCF